MASSVVVTALSAEPGATGLNITYSVAFQLDDGRVDMDMAVVEIIGGDSPNTINGKIAAAVRSIATARGYAIPTNAVSIPAYSKG